MLNCRINRNRLLFVVVILLLGQNHNAQVEHNKRTHSGWITAGVGLGSGIGKDDISVFGGFNYQNYKNLFTLQGALIFDNSSDLDFLNEISFLYGRVIRSNGIFLALSAGPSIVDGDLPYRTTQTIGLSLTAQAFYRIRFLGIGTYVLANINEYESYIAINLALKIGKLR